MKKLLITSLLALASFALLSIDGKAQVTINSNVGDVILGFRATSGTGANNDLEVDLGSIARFYNAAPGSIINLSGTTGLAAQDLVSTFGSDWATRLDTATGGSSVQWGVASTDGGTGTPDGHATQFANWVTDPEVTPGVLGTPWNDGNRFQQSPVSSKIETLEVPGAAGTIDGATSTANSNVSAVISASLQGSWTSEDQINPGASFGQFNPTIDSNTTPTLNGNSIADFYELQVGSGVGKLLGKFELSSAGTFEFVATPVPEPAPIGLMGVGFLSLIGMVALRRRHTAMA